MKRIKRLIKKSILLSAVVGALTFSNGNCAWGQFLGGYTPLGAPTINQSNYTACNLPPQPATAAGRCEPCMQAIDCADNCGGAQSWRDMHRYPFSPLSHGEFLGPIRLPATVQLRARIGDRLRFVFVLSRQVNRSEYRLQVGDQLEISSLTDETVAVGNVTQGKGVEIIDDGMLYLKNVGKIPAAGLTIPELQGNLEKAYEKYLQAPGIAVLPIKVNSALENIRAAVDARAGQGGQGFSDTVHQDGTVRLPRINAICVHGMTLDEIKREVNLRYAEIVTGLEVEPILEQAAQHFVFVYGQVNRPGRYEMLGQTNVLQALSMAEGIKPGGNAREIVIFRYGEDWRLIATRLDLKGAILGKAPTPSDNIWLRDNDLIIIPPTPIERFDQLVEQVFTRGAYGIFRFSEVGSGFGNGGFQ